MRDSLRPTIPAPFDPAAAYAAAAERNARRAHRPSPRPPACERPTLPAPSPGETIAEATASLEMAKSARARLFAAARTEAVVS